jgi:hypothetical protein
VAGIQNVARSESLLAWGDFDTVNWARPDCQKHGAESQGQYVTSYLKNEDDAGFLRTEPNLKWQHLLEVFQGDAEQFEQQAKAAGVPFVAVLVPNRAQPR